MAKAKEKKAKVDRGAGYVTVLLDHATGGVRIGHDNLLPQELAAVTSIMQAYVGKLLEEQQRQQVRAEIEAELKAQRSG